MSVEIFHFIPRYFDYQFDFCDYFYRCPLESEREKALFLYNEKPLPLEWCQNGLCDWSEVKEQYSFFTSDSCRNLYC